MKPWLGSHSTTRGSYDPPMDDQTPSTTESESFEPDQAPDGVAVANDELTIALTPPQLAIVVVVLGIIIFWVVRRRRRKD